MSADGIVDLGTGEKIADCTPEEARDLTDRIRTAVGVSWELIVRAYTGRAWAALGHSTWDAYTAAEFGSLRLRLPSEERQEIVASLREAGLSQRAIAAAIDVSAPTVRDDLRSGGRNLSPEQDRQPVEPNADAHGAAPGGDGGTGSEAPAASEPDPADKITGLDGKEYPTPALAAAAKRRAVDAYAANPDLTVRELAKLAGCSVGTAQSVMNPAAPKKQVDKRPALGPAADKAGWEFRKAVERLERIAADDRFPANREQVAAALRGHLTYAVEVCQDLLDGFTTEPQEAP